MIGDAPGWVEPLCRIAQQWRTSGLSIREHFEAVQPNLGDGTRAVGMIRQQLSQAPDLIEAWQQYSWDKRTTPGHYLDGLEVGFFTTDGLREDVQLHDEPADACADFVYREAVWVLDRHRA